MYRGWIKLHRKIKDNVFWDDKPFSKGQAWVDLLLIANHKEGIIKVKNGELITIKRGECGYSQKGLADKWGWSKGKVNRFLCFLNERGMVLQKIIENHTVTAILNYDSYQDESTNESTNRSTNGQQTGRQTDTNKNDKNDKNDKKYAEPDFLSILTFFNKQLKKEYNLHSTNINHGATWMMIRDRLETFGEDKLRLAISNFANDDWEDRKKHTSPHLLFKDDATVEDWIQKEPARRSTTNLM